MTYTLNRISDSGNETFGIWLNPDGSHLCVTIERSASDPDHPCIPPATYECDRFQSPHNGDVWLLKDVPGRSMIEVHAANFAKQLLGCIAVGDTIGQIDGVPAVLNSQRTLAKLHTILPDVFDLHIIAVDATT